MRAAVIWTRIRRLLSPRCREMTELISRSLDEKLPFWERCAYKLHIVYCRYCRRYLKQLLTLRAVLKSTDESASQAASPQLSGAARERLQVRLDAIARETPPQ